jgi:hypothetical protein
MEVSIQLQVPAAYPRRKRPTYPLDKRLSGSQSQSGRRGEQNPDSSAIHPVARPYTDWAIRFPFRTTTTSKAQGQTPFASKRGDDHK